MNSEDIYKIDGSLPPIKESRKLGNINSSTAMPKQIFLNFTGKLDMSTSPRHIRIPKPKKVTDLRHLTRSQLASIDSKKVKNLKLFSLPLDKDYFNRKIKKTVKHYFQSRRTSIGPGFLPNESQKEKMPSLDTGRNDPKNHRIYIELDPTCDLTGRTDWKAAATRVVNLSSPVSPGAVNRVESGNTMESFDGKASRFEKMKKGTVYVEKVNYNKCDQGLQTEEVLLSNN